MRKTGGFEYTQEILTAIKQQRKIEFEYQKFKEEKLKKYTIEPYALKEFENRWYLVGLIFGKPGLYKFGIERIMQLSVTTQKFKRDKTASVAEHFARMIGVNDQQKERETVHLAFTPLLAKYVETLPLHWTQKEISKEKDWVIFEYYLIPNFELEQKILSFGTEVKVVKSTKLKNRMRDILQNCLKYYS
jgi:predicted DNA-binding transcriptional regulator YafY